MPGFEPTRQRIGTLFPTDSLNITIRPIRAESEDIPGSVTRMGFIWLLRLPRTWDSAGAEFRAHPAKDRHFVPNDSLNYDWTDPGRKRGCPGICDSDGFHMRPPPVAYLE